ncbi:hypothetical protein LZ575_00725 [Antarcticibacterium sp. 1MA-6-2]|uniref:hypothetical protein n=1 Tax=Antarcticibacterium sp. 1MA-6-2 TaxID=2908210 RepID=UPI001F3E1A6A|nr:hypothetical protein [Antarcticibacterium sp. 1MA-6-2]UJH91355.1 hypothetical protein LZ575_00725 [Antarcticibacterium sp. 1MA-6-2]
MKKSFLTLAAIALVFSFTSCKETTVETTEDPATEMEVLETETESTEEVIEEAPVEEVDTTTATTGEDATIVE